MIGDNIYLCGFAWEQNRVPMHGSAIAVTIFLFLCGYQTFLE